MPLISKRNRKKFYEKTGMYIDWEQLHDMPTIDTLVDVGVGDKGTIDLYKRFSSAKLILVDPLEEARDFSRAYSGVREHVFFQTALGSKKGTAEISVEQKIGRSTLLQVTEINHEGDPVERRTVDVNTLDDLLCNSNDLGRVGLKIDVEGFECEVIEGGIDTLKQTEFVIAEVRHNHTTFVDGYKLIDFSRLMAEQGFFLAKIFTAKPFIADLCFCPVRLK